jgi:multidrug resistance efflux pump
VLFRSPFAAVLHRREPLGLQGDFRALYVGLVFPVYVRRYRLESGEAGQGQNLAQAMELDDGFDAVAALGAAPGSIGYAIDPPDIADTDGASHLVPQVEPTFDWVRLPQRVPVRIRLEDVPEDIQLISGMTASVAIRSSRED